MSGPSLKITQNDIADGRFRVAFETTAVVMIGLAPSHNILEFNREAEQLYGVRREEVLGKDYFQLFLPKEIWIDVASDIKKVLAGEPTKGFENIIRKNNGEERLLSWHVSRFLDHQGQPEGIIAIGYDVTEQRSTEEKLAAQERLYRTLANTIPHVVWIGDSEGKVTFLSQAWTDWTGREIEESLGDKWAESVHPDDLKVLLAKWERAFKRGEPHKGEYRVKTVNGLYKAVTFIHTPINDASGKTVNWVGINSDISEQKQSKILSDALNEINTAISSTFDIDEIIRRVIEEARQAMDSETALLTLRENDRWVMKYVDGWLSKDNIGTMFTEDQVRGSALAIKTGKPTTANDTDNDERFNHEFLGRCSVRSFLTVPLVIKQDIFGTIVFLNHSGPKVFTKGQIDFSEKLAGSVSLAMQNAQSHKMTRHALSDANALHSLATLITQTLELSDVLKTALDGAMDTVGAEHGCIYLIDKTGNLVIRSQNQLNQAFLEAKGTLTPGQGCAWRAAETKEIFAPTAEEHDYCSEDSKNLLGLDCLAAIPLVTRGKTLGVLEFFAPPHKRLSDRERRVVRTMADQLATAVENAYLYSAQRNIADTLQETFFTVPEEIKGLNFGHLYRAATDVVRVGGDFFDLFELENNNIAVLIGDVSGRGLKAAKMTSMIKNTIHAHSHEENSPAEILKMSNRSAYRTIPQGSFVTVFFGILNTTTGLLTYCNAGHPPPIVRRAEGRSSVLATGNSPIGVFEDVDYNNRRVRLKNNDLLFAYTDGLIEARCGTKLFGEKRLCKAVKELASTPVSKLPLAVFDRVLEFTDVKLVDDIAILSLSLNEIRGKVGHIEYKIGAAQTKKEVLDILGSGLTEELSAYGTGVFLIDRDKKKLYGAAAWPEEIAKIIRKVRISMDDSSSIVTSIARTGSVVVVDDAVNEPRGQKWLVALFGAKSFVVAPIATETKVIGIVAVGEVQQIRRFTEEEVEKVQYLASKAGEAISQLEPNA